MTFTPKAPNVHQQRILDSFVRHVASEGYDGTNFSTIAADLGVAKGTIAHHFGTKEHLLATMHEQYMAGLRGLGKVLAEGPIDGDPKLREYIVIRAADPGEAMTLVASDPAVKSRERTLRTHGWTTFKGIFK